MKTANLTEMDRRKSWEILIEIMYDNNVSHAVSDCLDAMARANDEVNRSLYSRLFEDFKILVQIRADRKIEDIFKKVCNGKKI